jgi:hypothetical protein
MRSHRSLLSAFVLVALLAFPVVSQAQDATPAAGEEGVTGSLTVVASGLAGARGFTWGPDGTLYMALAGWGGDTTLPLIEGFTVSIGLSSSVVTIADGCVTPVVQGLVSTR